MRGFPVPRYFQPVALIQRNVHAHQKDLLRALMENGWVKRVHVSGHMELPRFRDFLPSLSSAHANQTNQAESWMKHVFAWNSVQFLMSGHTDCLRFRDFHPFPNLARANQTNQVESWMKRVFAWNSVQFLMSGHTEHPSI